MLKKIFLPIILTFISQIIIAQDTPFVNLMLICTTNFCEKDKISKNYLFTYLKKCDIILFWKIMNKEKYL